jgi:hypothetical protein
MSKVKAAPWQPWTGSGSRLYSAGRYRPCVGGGFVWCNLTGKFYFRGENINNHQFMGCTFLQGQNSVKNQCSVVATALDIDTTTLLHGRLQVDGLAEANTDHWASL